jgi:hypothetical protein
MNKTMEREKEGKNWVFYVHDYNNIFNNTYYKILKDALDDFNKEKKNFYELLYENTDSTTNLYPIIDQTKIKINKIIEKTNDIIEKLMVLQLIRHKKTGDWHKIRPKMVTLSDIWVCDNGFRTYETKKKGHLRTPVMNRDELNQVPVTRKLRLIAENFYDNELLEYCTKKINNSTTFDDFISNFTQELIRSSKVTPKKTTLDSSLSTVVKIEQTTINPTIESSNSPNFPPLKTINPSGIPTTNQGLPNINSPITSCPTELNNNEIAENSYDNEIAEDSSDNEVLECYANRINNPTTLDNETLQNGTELNVSQTPLTLEKNPMPNFTQELLPSSKVTPEKTSLDALSTLVNIQQIPTIENSNSANPLLEMFNLSGIPTTNQGLPTIISPITSCRTELNNNSDLPPVLKSQKNEPIKEKNPKNNFVQIKKLLIGIVIISTIALGYVWYKKSIESGLYLLKALYK